MLPEELGQAKAQGEGGGKDQPGIGHQAVVVKEDADTVGFVLWQHLFGAPCFRAGFCSKTIIPDSQEHPLASSRAVPKAVLRCIRVKSTGGAVDEIVFQVANAAGGEAIDLTPGETIITYSDIDQLVTLASGDFTATGLGAADADQLLEVGEIFEIKITGLIAKLNTDLGKTRFFPSN